MPDARRDDDRTRWHVRLPSHPSSVPAARQFAVDSLRTSHSISTWGRSQLSDDAALCVSELASNATLHGGAGFFEVSLDVRPGAVRIAVADGGPVPASAVVARTAGGGTGGDLVAQEPATGRGLGIVARLSDAWGVDATEHGKSVWLLLVPGGDQSAPAQRSAPATGPDGSADALPDGWHLVELRACPVALSLRQDQHLDELVRELQLVDAGSRESSGPLAAVIERLLGRQAHARHAGRRLAQEAAAAGLDLIDIVMPVPRQAASDVRELQASVVAADALCEAAQLLTLASAPDVRALRAWMVHEFVRQVELGAQPLTFADWRSAGEPVAPGPRRGDPRRP